MFGWMGFALTFLANHFSATIGGMVGIVTLAVMTLRLRREWRHRNNPPPKDEL